MTAPGESGGDCKRCGGSTTMIGHGNAVYGVVCDDCELLHVVGNADVYGASVYDPEADP